MFQFLFGVAFGAAGYWAWQSFGRDLLGMGPDQGETSYGGFSSTAGGSTSYGSTPSSSSTTSGGINSSSPAGTTASGSTGSSTGTTTPTV